MADLLVKEDGGGLLLESGAGILLEQQAAPTGDDFLLQEDGLFKFALEDGTGFIILETSSGAAATPTGGGIIIPRRQLLVRRLRQEGFEEDEAIALSLLLRTRRRIR